MRYYLSCPIILSKVLFAYQPWWATDQTKHTNHLLFMSEGAYFRTDAPPGRSRHRRYFHIAAPLILHWSCQELTMPRCGWKMGFTSAVMIRMLDPRSSTYILSNAQSQNLLEGHHFLQWSSSFLWTSEWQLLNWLKTRVHCFERSYDWTGTGRTSKL